MCAYCVRDADGPDATMAPDPIEPVSCAFQAQIAVTVVCRVFKVLVL